MIYRIPVSIANYPLIVRLNGGEHPSLMFDNNVCIWDSVADTLTFVNVASDVSANGLGLDTGITVR